jgi:hypothetical protein
VNARTVDIPVKLVLDDVEAGRLALKPGDVVVVRSKRPLTSGAVSEIKATLASVLPAGTPTVVLTEGLDLVIVETESA